VKKVWERRSHAFPTHNTPGVKSEQRNVNLNGFDVEWRRTKALSVRMRHRKQGPTAVMNVCRLSCQLLDCSRTSALRWIMNGILL